ncbi:MAG: hypothetical protein SGJ00_12700 [bacterium]|nr:hypothetical protein [bacterium]
MTRNRALEIVSVTKHQYHHKSNGKRLGRKKSTTIKQQLNEGIEELSNEFVVSVVQGINADSDT